MHRKILGILAALILFATQANALVYTLDLNNEGISGGPWATVKLTDTIYQGKDSVRFQVTPLQDAFDGISDNFGLQSFYFNENTGLANFSDVVTIQFVTPTDWKLFYDPAKGINGTGPYGKFELLYAGEGNSRANPLEFYLSSNTPFDIGAAQFAVTGDHTDYMFAAHIAGFTVDGSPKLTSAKFGSSGEEVTPTPVPEPGTMILLGTGFLGLAIFGKRRRNA